MAANGAELQNEVIEGAAAQTAEQANPGLSDMDAKSPSKENMVCDLGLSAASSVEPNSAEERETVNSRENEPAHELAIGVESNVEVEASKENSSSSEKLDTVVEVSNGKMSPLRSSAEEISKACSQTDDPETINVVAVTDLAALEACAHAIGFENAEITLVVEMNTDADLIPEIGEKGEESKLGGVDTLMEHSKDAVTRVEVLEQTGSFSKNWDTGAEPAAVQQHTQTIVMESMLQQNMENIKPPDHLIDHDVPAASHMHADVETETLVFKNEGVTDGCSLKESADEAKAVERKQEEGHIPAEIQIGEDVGTCTGELDAKPVSILNAASGAAAEGVTNDEETKNGETGELVEGSTDMEVEMESGTTPSRKTGVEESIAGDRGHTDELLADVVDGERNTDGMVVKEPAPLAEQGKCAVSETWGESSLCMKGADKYDSVEGCQGSERGSAEEMVVIRKEQGPGSITQQRELGVDRGLLENVGVYTGPLQESEGRNGVQEGLGTVEGKLGSTEALGNEEALREEEPGQCSKSHTGMDADTIVFEKLRMNVDLHQHMGSVSGEKTKERRQEMLFGTDADISKETGSNQHHQDVEIGSGSGIRHDATRGGARHQLVEAGKEIQGDLLACHIASSANSETSQALDLAKAERGGQRKEEAHHLVGQEVQTSPAVQGLLQNPRSKDVAVEPNYTEGERRVQLERHHNRQVHTEMRVRLQTETLSSDKRAKADLRRNQEVMEGGSGMQTPKDLSLAKHKEVKDEELGQAIGQHWRVGIVMQVKAKADIMSVEGKQQGHMDTRMKEVGYEENQGWAFQGTSYENAAGGISRGERAGVLEEEKIGVSDEANTGTSEEEKYSIIGLEKGGMSEKATLKRKFPENVASDSGAVNEHGQNDNVVKKAKKKNVNVWAKTSSRKGPKKNSKNGIPQNPSNEASVLLTPVYINPDKLEDGPDQPIALSKYDKAEKIELSENRLIASSTKGYRMVRATRGVQEGTWYFEIVVEQLGPTGHTRLGWSTQKGDVQAPVGFDSNSYGYRDLDGSKTHVAVREPYGDLYVEGDVIGFYIHLPDGAEYAPKPAPLLSYRGRPYLSDIKEEHPRKVPGSEICFFRNGVCQGTAFKDINAGRYFPAASMYTLPKEPNCTVRFNFGPEFRFPPLDIGDRPEPKAMFYAPYHNVVNGKEVGSVALANVSATGNATLNSEPQMKIV